MTYLPYIVVAIVLAVVVVIPFIKMLFGLIK